MTTIREIVEIVGDHRIEGEPAICGDWLVWNCGHSPKTMGKFVERCKKAGVPAFCRPGKFGVLRDAVRDE